MCARFGFDVEAAWNMTPGEFGLLVEGWNERVRDERLNLAKIESAILAFGGVRMSPLALIGEQQDYGENPFFKDAEDADRRKSFLRKLDERARAEHGAWLPRGIVDDDGVTAAVLTEEMDP